VIPIKALIIDDEERACNVLRALIEKYTPEITELEVVTSASDGYFKIKEYQPDLLFLDIQMPFMNGFDLLNKVGEINFDIIFTTAFNHYAIKAIRFSALDYLLKPVDIAELRGAVNRHLQRRMQHEETSLQYKNLVQNFSAKTNDQFSLAISGSQGMRFFPVSEIIRLEGERNYTQFHFTQGRKYLSSKTLKEYDDILSEKGFIRIHKSHLVNSAFIQVVDNEGKMTLRDGSQVEVSRRRLADVKKVLG
jgi:two-component system, LytTR family, response regulator